MDLIIFVLGNNMIRLLYLTKLVYR